MINRLAGICLLAISLCATALAADPSGKWTASFDTQIGVQNYVFEFKTEGQTLTGTASSNVGGNSELHNGKFVDGTLTFTESFKFEDMDIPIAYTGKLSGDEIQFTRNGGIRHRAVRGETRRVSKRYS
jgi:hypothetical protein